MEKYLRKERICGGKGAVEISLLYLRDFRSVLTLEESIPKPTQPPTNYDGTFQIREVLELFSSEKYYWRKIRKKYISLERRFSNTKRRVFYRASHPELS